LKATIKTIAALAMLAYSAPAIAGGVNVYNDGVSKLKLGGKIFSDVTSFKASDGTGKVTKRTKGARIERAYLTTKYYFNSDWMMRVTTDVVLDKTKTISKNNRIFLKYAYLEGKLYGKAAVLRVGQSHTPWIDHEEELWGHRYFSKVLIDTNGYDASSDLGIGLKGSLADGMAKYFVTYTNGAGYSHPNRTSNSMDVDSRFGLYPIEGLTLDFQYRNGYKSTKKSPATPAKKRSILTQVMATYGVEHEYRIGANYAINKMTPTVTQVSVKQTAVALWGWANITNGFGVFARYENTKDDTQSGRKTIRYAGGIQYSPTKHVTLALALDHTKTTGLLAIAGSGVLKTLGKTDRIGLWTETKF